MGEVKHPVSSLIPALRSESVPWIQREHHLCLEKIHSEKFHFSDVEQNVGNLLPLKNLSKRVITDELQALLVMNWKHTALYKASKWCGVHHPVTGRVVDSLKAGLRSDSQVGFSFHYRHVGKTALFAKRYRMRGVSEALSSQFAYTLCLLLADKE